MTFTMLGSYMCICHSYLCSWLHHLLSLSLQIHSFIHFLQFVKHKCGPSLKGCIIITYWFSERSGCVRRREVDINQKHVKISEISFVGFG